MKKIYIRNLLENAVIFSSPLRLVLGSKKVILTWVQYVNLHVFLCWNTHVKIVRKLKLVLHRWPRLLIGSTSVER